MSSLFFQWNFLGPLTHIKIHTLQTSQGRKNQRGYRISNNFFFSSVCLLLKQAQSFYTFRLRASVTLSRTLSALFIAKHWQTYSYSGEIVLLMPLELAGYSFTFSYLEEEINLTSPKRRGHFISNVINNALNVI